MRYTNFKHSDNLVSNETFWNEKFLKVATTFCEDLLEGKLSKEQAIKDYTDILRNLKFFQYRVLDYISFVQNLDLNISEDDNK